MTDVIIIGAGPGGFDAALYAAKNGLSVILIEKHKVGGTCLNYGCIPTKALYQNAKMISYTENLDTFGVKVNNYELDFDKIKARKETIVETQIKGILVSLKKAGVTLIEGNAELIDHTTVKVGEETYTAKNIIIATGSHSKALNYPGHDLDIVKNSKQILDLKIFPKKLLVVGAGVIGTEMAQIFKSFGAEVTLIDFMDDILMTEDKDIRKRAKSLFKRSGLTVHTNASIKSVEKQGDGYVASFDTKKGLETVEVDTVLMAVGRHANLGGIDTLTLGINTERGKILVNDQKQTSIENIYAIGDVNEEMMLAHKATYDGYRAINHILNKKDTIQFDLVPSVIFTSPLIASVGKREDDIEDASIKTVKALFKANAKAQAMDDTDGFVKLIADKNDYLIGAHVIGNGADFIIHELTALMQKRATIHEAHDMIHAHPTVSEVIHDALRQME